MRSIGVRVRADGVERKCFRASVLPCTPHMGELRVRPDSLILRSRCIQMTRHSMSLRTLASPAYESMMKRKPVPGPAAERWATRWLESVAIGNRVMSRRLVTSVDTRGGGLIFVRSLARQRGLHLLLLVDADGNQLVAASKSRFRVVC